jgi:hypothetical protein
MFETAGSYVPGTDFVGTAGGDALCTSLANQAGLSGTFEAWLSDATSSPSTRFTASGVAWFLTSGALVANSWTDLITNGPRANLNVDQNKGTVVSGARVWTGTSTTGTTSGPNCANWATTHPGTGTGAGGVGDYAFTSGFWTVQFSQGCSLASHLYCFQQN